VFLVWQHGKNTAQNAATFAWSGGYAASQIGAAGPVSPSSGMQSFDPIAIFDSRRDAPSSFGTPCRSDGLIGCAYRG